jgi:hypothetical protein
VEVVDGRGRRVWGDSDGVVQAYPCAEAGLHGVQRGGTHTVVGGDAHHVDILDPACAQPVREGGSFFVGSNSWRSGEAFFDTTATAAGAIGKCATY